MATSSPIKLQWCIENAAVGRRLRHYRNQACLSMDQLVDLARIGKSTLQRYESGTQTLSCAIAQVIADILGVPAWRILYGEDE